MSDAIEVTGERYYPAVQRGPMALEHWHRYFFARHYVAGRRVLDVASGSGYGSAYLAEHAAQVTGVDISADTISFARSKYQRPNLEYRVGDASEIPLADGSVDVIVSFETIEHHDRHELMLKEFKRLLAPGGTVIISSPDKYRYSDLSGYRNPYHVKELYEAEFRELLGRYFQHLSFHAQRTIYGSVILPMAHDARDEIRESLECSAAALHAGQAVDPRIESNLEPYFHICVCSDREPSEVSHTQLSVFHLTEFLETFAADVEANVRRSWTWRLGTWCLSPLRFAQAILGAGKSSP